MFHHPQRIAYVYKAQKAINGTKVRVIWGRVTRAHGKRICLAPHCFQSGGSR